MFKKIKETVRTLKGEPAGEMSNSLVVGTCYIVPTPHTQERCWREHGNFAEGWRAVDSAPPVLAWQQIGDLWRDPINKKLYTHAAMMNIRRARTGKAADIPSSPAPAPAQRCEMCETGKHPKYGGVQPRKLINIRGGKAWRHEHEGDRMFTTDCAIQVADPAPPSAGEPAKFFKHNGFSAQDIAKRWIGSPLAYEAAAEIASFAEAYAAEQTRSLQQELAHFQNLHHEWIRVMSALSVDFTGLTPAMYGSPRTMFETIQAALKLAEGEIEKLRAALSRMNRMMKGDDLPLTSALKAVIAVALAGEAGKHE